METTSAARGSAEGTPGAAVRWTGRQRVGFADVDQDSRIKFASIVRFVMAGYEGLFPQLGTTAGRAEYFATYGLTPITTYAELERAPRSATLDIDVDLRYCATLGFELGGRGNARRYGGHDEIELTCADGEPLGWWRQHWLWFSQEHGALLDRPAPGIETAQSVELQPAPRPPDASAPAAAGRFRWGLRETDLNHHVTFAAYLERAENALADAQLDASPPDRASIWFRRPSFAGEVMTSFIAGNDRAFVVRLTREQPDELCATVSLSSVG